MKQAFEFIINSRKAFIKLIDGLTIEQLNKIPEDYNNNIIWNFGHIVVTTQALCYIRTGLLQDASSIEFNEFYKKDTKPTYTVTADEVEELREMAIQSINKIEADYAAGKFGNVTPFSTSTYGVQMNTVDEILITTIGHDNMHFGYAIALRKLV
ncbi:DinB family protein [Pedobacter changchengzhani]|nr:DinB family protein [Pedobacter changchengzhani]